MVPDRGAAAELADPPASWVDGAAVVHAPAYALATPARPPRCAPCSPPLAPRGADQRRRLLGRPGHPAGRRRPAGGDRPPGPRRAHRQRRGVARARAGAGQPHHRGQGRRRPHHGHRTRRRHHPGPRRPRRGRRPRHHRGRTTRSPPASSPPSPRASPWTPPSGPATRSPPASCSSRARSSTRPLWETPHDQHRRPHRSRRRRRGRHRPGRGHPRRGHGVPIFSNLGLPAPGNREAFDRCEAAVRGAGAVPAVTAVLDGRPRVGLAPEDVDRVLTGSSKVAERDVPWPSPSAGARA